MRKMQFFYENMLGKVLRFGRMHKKIFFFKGEIILKAFLYIYFVEIFLEKTKYFNTRFLFYSVNIQPDIMQNW